MKISKKRKNLFLTRARRRARKLCMSCGNSLQARVHEDAAAIIEELTAIADKRPDDIALQRRYWAITVGEILRDVCYVCFMDALRRAEHAERAEREMREVLKRAEQELAVFRTESARFVQTMTYLREVHRG